MIKHRIKTNPVVSKLLQTASHVRWVLGGRIGGASHTYKQQTLRHYARTYGLTVLVETGTYLGDMVYAMRNDYTHIYSIELDHSLYLKALRRFAGNSRITIIEGDSANVLPSLVPQIQKPVLFWLDGHYSGGNTAKGELDTPVLKELNAIFFLCKQPFAILIDDARLFTGEGHYPKLENLKIFVKEQGLGFVLEVEYDIIRIYKHD
jgi:hypothetical protein